MDSKIFDEALQAVESSTVSGKDKAKEIINREKNRIMSYVQELKKMGMESKVYAFVEKCLGNLKDLLYAVIGKCKELYEYVCNKLKGLLPVRA